MVSELSTVPPLMAPFRLFSPPVPNKPALPMSSVLPVLSSGPAKLMNVPGARFENIVPRLLARPAVVAAIFKVSVPLLNAMLPLLVKLL